MTNSIKIEALCEKIFEKSPELKKDKGRFHFQDARTGEWSWCGGTPLLLKNVNSQEAKEFKELLKGEVTLNTKYGQWLPIGWETGISEKEADGSWKSYRIKYIIKNKSELIQELDKIIVTEQNNQPNFTPPPLLPSHLTLIKFSGCECVGHVKDKKWEVDLKGKSYDENKDLITCPQCRDLDKYKNFPKKLIPYEDGNEVGNKGHRIAITIIYGAKKKNNDDKKGKRNCCNCKLEVKSGTFVNPSFIFKGDVFAKNESEEVEGSGWFFCHDCLEKIFKCWVCKKGNCFTSSNQRYCTKKRGEYEYICNNCSESSSSHSSKLSESEPTSGILYHLKEHRKSCEVCRKEYEKNKNENGEERKKRPTNNNPQFPQPNQSQINQYLPTLQNVYDYIIANNIHSITNQNGNLVIIFNTNTNTNTNTTPPSQTITNEQLTSESSTLNSEQRTMWQKFKDYLKKIGKNKTNRQELEAEINKLKTNSETKKPTSKTPWTPWIIGGGIVLIIIIALVVRKLIKKKIIR